MPATYDRYSVSWRRSKVRNEQPTGVPFTFPVGSSHCTPHGGAVRDVVAITKKFRLTATVRGGAIWYVTVTEVTPLGTSPNPGVPISDISAYGLPVAGAQSWVPVLP